MKNPLVIYHSSDYDGIFCREIARKFLPNAELVGWNFGDPPLSIPHEGTIYILDLPVDRVFGYDFTKRTAPPGPPAMQDEVISRVIWIDHHKSSIETHPKDIPGYRIDGVAACRLAWQWFSENLKDSIGMNLRLPKKQDYIDRKVSEPLAVRLAGEYDIWDKRDPSAETFQYGLRCYNDDNVKWDKLLDEAYIGKPDTVYLFTMLVIGDAAQRYAQNIDSDLVKNRSYRLDWEGMNFIALNTGRFNSMTFAALDVPETGHDALLGYMFNGKCWTVSLYHAKHRTDLDLSEIAKRYGGGGHRGACGFTCLKLPFMQ